jgi:hypothetical protein
MHPTAGTAASSPCRYPITHPHPREAHPRWTPNAPHRWHRSVVAVQVPHHTPSPSRSSPKVDTKCTPPSLIPTINGNAVRSADGVWRNRVNRHRCRSHVQAVLAHSLLALALMFPPKLSLHTCGFGNTRGRPCARTRGAWRRRWRRWRAGGPHGANNRPF